MKYKQWLVLFVFHMIYLFNAGFCFDFGKRDSSQDNYRPNSHNAPLISRQMPMVSSALTGPLALATFLFALPLLPSVIMAPLAIAGIPPAINMLSNIVTGLTNGRPINLMNFNDPLQSSDSASSDSSKIHYNKITRRNLIVLKNIAKAVRSVVSKRYQSVYQGNLNEPEVSESQNKPTISEEETGGVLDSLNGTLPLLSANASSPISASHIEKSLKGMDTVLGSIREIYSVIRNGLRRYEITDTDCQSRIVCEIHQKIISHNKLLKSFSLNALDLLRLERYVDTWSTLNEKSKQTIKFYINAAKTGFADKDCSQEFSNCPTLHTRNLRLKKLLSYHKILLRT